MTHTAEYMRAYQAAHPEECKRYYQTYYWKGGGRAKRAAYVRSPAGRYQAQRIEAGRRGIEWKLTFQEWVEWWGDDYSKRGRGPDDLVMGRIGDIGPYSLDNIEKITKRQNCVNQRMTRRMK